MKVICVLYINFICTVIYLKNLGRRESGYQEFLKCKIWKDNVKNYGREKL